MNRPHGQFTLQCGHDPALAQIVDDDNIGDYDDVGGYDAWCYVCEAWVQTARVRAGCPHEARTERPLTAHDGP